MMNKKGFRFFALRAWTWAVLLMLAGCGGGGSDGASSSPSVFGETNSSTIASLNTGQSYGFQVHLPQGYDKSNLTYPVVYATDAEYRASVLIRELQNSKRNDLILVTVNANSPARRFVDFPMPGAESYYRFLTTELIPWVDARYRTDIKSRVLTGHSLSAEFVLFALFLEAPDKRYFSAFIANDCSCWLLSSGGGSDTWDVPITMEQQMFDRSRNLPVTLVMAGDSGNAPRVSNWYNRIVSRGYIGLNARLNTYNLGHGPMDGPAFSDALTFVLGPPH